MISKLVNLDPRVKQLERRAGFAQHQVHGAGGDVKPHFSPPVLLHTLATVLESLLPIELS